jgi:hypothetical protein
VTIALALYDVVLALHIMAVVIAFGLPMIYPVLLPAFRSLNPRAMPAVHQVQERMGSRIIGPGLGVIVLLGIYLATKAHVWGEVWVIVPLVIAIVAGAIGGAVMGPSHLRLSELAAADVAASGPDGPVSWSAEYESFYARTMRFELFLMGLVLVAIFFMAAKPFA